MIRQQAKIGLAIACVSFAASMFDIFGFEKAESARKPSACPAVREVPEAWWHVHQPARSPGDGSGGCASTVVVREARVGY